VHESKRLSEQDMRVTTKCLHTHGTLRFDEAGSSSCGDMQAFVCTIPAVPAVLRTVTCFTD